MRDLDFEIRDKLFVESVFDIEFQDPSITDKAVFYTGKWSNLSASIFKGPYIDIWNKHLLLYNFFTISDTGHSFDALLLYGHEFSLTIFDVLIFSFVDLLVEDYLVAAIVTYFVGKVFSLNWFFYFWQNDKNTIKRCIIF